MKHLRNGKMSPLPMFRNTTWTEVINRTSSGLGGTCWPHRSVTRWKYCWVSPRTTFYELGYAGLTGISRLAISFRSIQLHMTCVLPDLLLEGLNVLSFSMDIHAGSCFG